VRPLFSYYGGKQRIATKILQHFPPHSVYVEPFAGGAALLFAKGVLPVTNKNYYREVLNDTNDLVHTVYKVAREQPQEFDRLVIYTPYGKQVYSDAIKICKNPSDYDELKVAWAFFVNINQSFSSTLGGGWKRAVYGANQAEIWRSRKQSIRDTLQRLAGVHIESADALDCIDKWDSPQTLFYCDPPYPDANQGHYGGYTIYDFERLCNKLDSIRGSYVLSNYDQGDVYPKSAERFEIVAHCSASGAGQVGASRSRKSTSAELGNRKRVEVLWVCDRSGGVRDELRPILAKNKEMQSRLSPAYFATAQKRIREASAETETERPTWDQPAPPPSHKQGRLF
jgi:DNA adenine methylase